MANLKKIAVAVTVGVWTSALGSAVALAYALNRPLEPRLIPEPTTAPAAIDHMFEAPLPPRRVELPVAPPTLAPAPSPVRPAPARPPAKVASPTEKAPTDIAEMKCNEWRDLQIGSGRVQVCE